MDLVTLTSCRPADPQRPGKRLSERMAVAVGATELGVVRVVSGPGAVAARWDHNGRVAEDWVNGVCGAFEGDWEATHAVPIDWDALGASDLERRVWDFLRGVGPGETVSAAEVAEAVTTDVDEAVGPLPQPADVLAACAKDPIPALIPCGRVTPGGSAAPRPVGWNPGGPPARGLAPRSPLRRPVYPQVPPQPPPRRRPLRRALEVVGAAARAVVIFPVFFWYFVIKRERIGW